MLALIAMFSFVEYLADAAPDRALKIDRAHPVALLSVAERRLESLQKETVSLAQASPVPNLPPQAGARSKVPTQDAMAPRLSHFSAPSVLRPDDRPGSSSPEDEKPDDHERKGPDPIELAAIRDMVVTSLRREPLNYRGLTLLGRIADLSADDGADAAKSFYELAARLSPRASEAHYWLMRHNADRKDYAQALRQADTLLRTVSRAGPAVMPTLAKFAETPEAVEHLKGLLVGNPKWRRQFLEALPRYITDARTPLGLLIALKDTEHPPTVAELRGYLNFLAARNLHELAYYTWLQFLPQERLASTGLVFNGGFDEKPTGFPFDWVISAGTGTIVEVLPVPGEAGRTALQIQFTDGRVQFGGVAQSLLLSPGQYTLTGRYRGELIGKRGLRWRLVCFGSPRVLITETPMHLGNIISWREFRQDFAVPATGCEAQQVRLELDARSASERLVRGTFWYDDILIQRANQTEQVIPKL